jgi:hypothetical protein
MKNRGMRKWNTEMLNIEYSMLNVEVEGKKGCNVQIPTINNVHDYFPKEACSLKPAAVFTSIYPYSAS